MADKSLQGLKIAILATDGVEQVELLEPRKAFADAGAQTTLIAPKSGKIQGMKHHDKADQLDVDMSLDDARPEDFDAVLLPGGALNADALRVSEKARDFVRSMDAAGKPFAIICHAPWLLVSAGLAKGRSMTSYHTIQDDMRNAGANWSDKEVVVDRNWVMSRQPSDIPGFNREAIKLFAQKRS
ncbi:MAG: type 1 glutamine amidotransferase domain-containing protein [Syntrophorhabdaceae bacterium]